MPRQPRDVQQFRRRALDSIRLSIELFNRPHEQGRVESVLLLSLHAHEMLAKAIVRKHGRSVWRRRESRSISYEKALAMLGPDDLGIIDEGMSIALRALSNLRDAAQHYILDLSEQDLYLQIQGAVTSFDSLLRAEFQEGLADHLPARVLPISTQPPESLELLVDSEVSQIRDLLRPGRRRTAQAKAKLRAMVALDLAAAGQHRNASPLEIDRAAKRLREGRAWQDVLPNLASLAIETTGTGQTFNLRITKRGEAGVVRFAETEDEAEDAAIIREVDRTNQYPFLVSQLADLCGLTRPKTSALVWKLGLLDDENYSTVFTHGRSTFRQYNHEALRKLREAAGQLDMHEVWADYRAREAQ